VHERISVDSICFPGAPFRDQAQYWRTLGARRVSFISPPLLADGVEPVKEALATGDYQVETIAHGPLPDGQLTFDEASWSAGRERVSRLIRMAAEFGGRSVYIMTGGHGTLTWEEAANAFSAAVAPCLAEARAAGIRLMIENAPATSADVTIAHSLRDAVTLAEIADVGLNIDLYGCWTEAGLKASIERAMPRCGLVQVSDYVLGDRASPCRAVPGDGAIPLERLLDWVLAAGYTGAFDLELIGPRIDKEGHFDAVRRAADRVGEILHKLGA
jgi:sugar phosphate isomerase/epimerase